MATSLIPIQLYVWTKCVDKEETDFLITWDNSTIVEFAVTDEDVAPTTRGHRIVREKGITKEDLGAGFVWAKLVSKNGPPSVNIVVSKTRSNAGATGGFDAVEGVHKVAMMVWDSDLLTWTRASSTGGSSGGGSSSSLTKRFEILPTVIYKGQAPLASNEASPVWVISKVELVSGNPVSVKIATGAWSNRGSLEYT